MDVRLRGFVHTVERQVPDHASDRASDRASMRPQRLSVANLMRDCGLGLKEEDLQIFIEIRVHLVGDILELSKGRGFLLGTAGRVS